MEKKYISYMENLPLRLELKKIDKIPLTWQDSLRVFLVLKGEIIIGLENEEYLIKSEEIEIINQEEMYYVKSQSKENIVLILDINPDFLNSHGEGFKNMYYYTNTLTGAEQSSYKYIKLREYISIIFYEVLNKQEGYRLKIKEVLYDFIYHLLNNFHYLFYEEESLREDDVQLERFTRIIDYIRLNYNKKVVLKEIAAREYLTPQYLSYKIKDTFGQGFNDFLNNIRIEESKKLLLGTEKSISEISSEVGFSHIRYYNKHFKNIYGISPDEYRKKYRISTDKYLELKSTERLDLKIGLKYLEKYILEYERYMGKLDQSLHNIKLDSPYGAQINKIELMKINDVESLLNLELYLEILELKNTMGLKYLAFNIENRNLFNVSKVMSQLEKVGIKSIIVDSNGYSDSLEDGQDFIKINSWKDLEGDYFKLKKSRLNDSLEILPIIFKEILESRRLPLLELIDDYKEFSLFSGGSGLLTSNGIKKPLYYLMFIISQLEGRIIYKKDQVLLVENNRGYSLLIYNPNLEDKLYEKISINLSRLKRDYSVIRYEINKELSSVYDDWVDLGRPKKLDGLIYSNLKNFNSLKVNFSYIKKSNVFNITDKLVGNKVILYSLNKLKD